MANTKYYFLLTLSIALLIVKKSYFISKQPVARTYIKIYQPIKFWQKIKMSFV